MPPQIRIKNGVSKGAVLTVTDQPLTIGRDPSCDIQLLDKGASRIHSEVFRIGEMCFLRDMKSRNGTFVNDTRVDEELLREGDRIMIGSTMLVFENSVENRNRIEFSGEEEEEFGHTLTLQIEDLSEMNVTTNSTEGEGIRLQALYRLSRLLAEEREEKTLVNKVLEFAATVVSADNAYLFVPDAQSGNIVPLGMYAQSEKSSTKVSRSIIRRSLQEKRAILTTDAMKDARFSARESIVLKQIHSVICAPLSASAESDSIGGVLYLAGDRPQQVFSEEDLEIAAAMAQITGLALGGLRILRQQRESYMKIIRGIIRAGEMRDPSIKGRCNRMAGYAVAISQQMGLEETACDNIQLAALLSDLGRLIIDEGSIYAHQFEAGMSVDEKRTIATKDILLQMNPSPDVLNAIEWMAERYDGNGPRGKGGVDIPLGAQILAVSSAFERMVCVHIDARPEEATRRALVDLNSQSGKAYSPDVIKALLIAHRQGALYGQEPCCAGQASAEEDVACAEASLGSKACESEEARLSPEMSEGISSSEYEDDLVASNDSDDFDEEEGLTDSVS